jgi:aquaporin Z
MPTTLSRILVAEMFGTMLLMLGGPGSAVLAGSEIGFHGIALAFGLSLLVAAYAIGPISGCHINPAVTLGMVLTKKTEVKALPAYVIGQVVGCILGAGIIWAIAQGKPGFDASATGFATNGWGSRSPEGFNFGAMMLVELVFTALLVFVVIAISSRDITRVIGGVVAGLTLTLIHLATIPVDNTSVNPVRSLGMVVWSGSGGAWKQLWAFIVFPLVGAFLAVLVWIAIDESRLEDTMLDVDGLRSARNAITDAGQRVEGFTARAGEGLQDRFESGRRTEGGPTAAGPGEDEPPLPPMPPAPPG